MNLPESWIREFCDPPLAAAAIAHLLTMSGVEVERCEAAGRDDHVFTFKLTPNRPDCLSALGIARELSALTGAKLSAPRIRAVPAASRARQKVRISHPKGCGRFAGRVIRGVDASVSTPAWMRERLERAGQRSISALVDVTNYVMLELGRPLHVYDLDRLRGPIDVRWGRKGEKVKLLNEQDVQVDESVLCITDDSGVIGLAGIMGGDSTKADLHTRDIFLESAFFYPEAIAGRARRYNFSSDASHRFERGVDFDNNVDGIERATRLILEICGGEPGPTADAVARLPTRKPVRLRVARAQKVIGMRVPEKEIARIFARLGLRASRRAGAFVVTPPSYRFDLEIEEDLIEEVARVHGYERIPAHPPRTRARMSPAPEARASLHAIRERLAGCDFQEVINYSFVDPQWEADFAAQADPIRLLNPISAQASVMRSTLLGSLIANLRFNLARQAPRVRVFEAGRVFLRDAAAPDGPLTVRGLRQPMRAAAAACGPAFEEQWGMAGRAVDFYDLKADLEALYWPRHPRFEAAEHPAFQPGRCARVSVNGELCGWIGEIHPNWLRKYELPHSVVAFEVEADSLTATPFPQPQVPASFPLVVRDIALVVDSHVTAQSLLDAAEGQRPPAIRQISVFDEYRGPKLPGGKKSLAFRVVMQDTERTLTDTEADAARDSLVALWGRKFGGTLRK